jgi:lipoprotein-anchoring transpeptidase ErfK/SrfK
VALDGHPGPEDGVYGDAAMPNWKTSQQVTHFQSLVPTATLDYTITPASGTTVGVAQPIVLRFDHSVTNKDAMLAALHVSESTAVSGGWHWFSSRELHFRPEKYWPAGEKVSITANLTAFNAGNGVWAIKDATTSFTIGDAHISTANVQTHTMTVTSNGAVVGTYPISAGRTIYPTMGGIHIDLYRQQDVHMVSSTVGIPVNSPNGYDEHVFWDVNISDGGEFVHAAPWSTGAQGNSNVSHGCINLSVSNATAFYNFSRIGDVIEVTGSPRPPDLGDHGTMDWNTPWSSWTPATA